MDLSARGSNWLKYDSAALYLTACHPLLRQAHRAVDVLPELQLVGLPVLMQLYMLPRAQLPLGELDPIAHVAAFGLVVKRVYPPLTGLPSAYIAT